jgi:hypothetical protein
MNMDRFARSLGRHSIVLIYVIATLFLCNCMFMRRSPVLQPVDFKLDRVSDVRIAGVSIEGKRSYEEFSLDEAVALAAAVGRHDVPLSFIAHVGAENPTTNQVPARLVAMQWTAYIRDKQTVSGGIGQEYELPAGQKFDVPLQVNLDIYDFFPKPAADLFQLAQDIATSIDTTTVSLRAAPTITTDFGPMEYPGDVTIRRRPAGAASATPPR